MGALPNRELLPVAHLVLSPSAAAIRRASSPHEALSLLKRRLRRHFPPDPFEAHAAVFTLKALSLSSLFPSSLSSPRLIPHLHAHLLKVGLFTHVHVASALLHAYSLLSHSVAHQLFDEIPNRNLVTANTMLACYSRVGDLSAARSLFDGISDKDIVTWSTLIAGYMDHGRNTEALALFREMMWTGMLKPDPTMLVTLLSGCACTGSLPLLCKSIHAYAEKHKHDINLHLGTSLIDMYAKSGCLTSAFRLFKRVPQRNVMHWTAMICGLAMHGHGKEALTLFDQMKLSNVRPNEITFTGLLNACCHAGLINQGQQFFAGMVEFGIKPGIYHYGCMVDLFAKAGRLDDACAVINNMKVEPNIVIWTSLLAACKKFQSFDIAEDGIRKVLSKVISVKDGGVYTLISDLYALGGRWNDVERVRRLMDDRNVRKARGSSFIKVDKCGSFAVPAAIN